MGNYCISKNCETQDLDTAQGKNDRLNNLSISKYFLINVNIIFIHLNAALKLKSNTKLLFTLIRVQARFRGLIIRKKVKNIKINSYKFNNDPNAKFARTSNDKIVIKH